LRKQSWWRRTRKKFCSKKTLTRDGQYFDPPAGVRVTHCASSDTHFHYTHHLTTTPQPAFIVTSLHSRQASRRARESLEAHCTYLVTGPLVMYIRTWSFSQKDSFYPSSTRMPLSSRPSSFTLSHSSHVSFCVPASILPR
jgi:hypothetical protein